MFRTSRRFAAVLLWVAVALLPLRGLAAAAMPAQMPALGGAPQTTVASMPAVQAMPCHGDAAHDDAHHQAASDAAEWGDCPSCSLCALCHGGLAQAPQVVLALSSPQGEPPAAHPWSARAPRAPDGLFRPPRSLLA
jgi:hypothetical protein